MEIASREGESQKLPGYFGLRTLKTFCYDFPYNNTFPEYVVNI
jgi:hypothetical protein